MVTIKYVSMFSKKLFEPVIMTYILKSEDRLFLNKMVLCKEKKNHKLRGLGIFLFFVMLQIKMFEFFFI